MVNKLIKKKSLIGFVILGLFLIIFMMDFAAASQRVTLAWNHSTSSFVTGYYIYYSTQSGVYSNTNRIHVGINDYPDPTKPYGEVSDLYEGVTYYFAVTAHNSYDVESVRSEEINYTIPLRLSTNPGLISGGSEEFPILPNKMVVYTVVNSHSLQSFNYQIESTTDLSTNPINWVPVADLYSDKCPTKSYFPNGDIGIYCVFNRDKPAEFFRGALIAKIRR